MGQKSSKENHKSHTIVQNGKKDLPTPFESPVTRAETTRNHNPPPPRHDSQYQHSPSNRYDSSRAMDSPVEIPSYPLIRQTSSGSSKANLLDLFFKKYKDESEDAILAEGMEKFCDDLGVSPTDFIVLVLAWKFRAAEMCRFTREEFVNGCQRLKATDVKGLKQKFPELVQETQNSEKSFKELYLFTFSFGLDHSSGQRALPLDMAIPLWELLFTHYNFTLLPLWFKFLHESETRVISRDTWNMFLPFIKTMKPDFSNYDEFEAWPSLFDDFVEQQLEKGYVHPVT